MEATVVDNPIAANPNPLGDQTKFATLHAVEPGHRAADVGRANMIAPDEIETTSDAQRKHLSAFQEGCADWLSYQNQMVDEEELLKYKKVVLWILGLPDDHLSAGTKDEESTTDASPAETVASSPSEAEPSDDKVVQKSFA